MPYANIDDLPTSVKEVLPTHAQEIYLSAFNNAWKQYKNPSKRATPESQEAVSHKVAWAAVKKKYRKKGHTWTEIK